MEERSKQSCIRCQVTIHLAKASWEDNSGVSVILKGAPVFVRSCVLGQLQHSHLHTPTFPLILNQTLTFDRVLTNCRNRSLFKEVIHGEHIKFELIQVSSDFRGGKILARFDTTAHKFLYPDSSTEALQTVILNKSRKYQRPPGLSYTCSVSLSEVTVHTPLDSIIAERSILREQETNEESHDQLSVSALGATSPVKANKTSQIRDEDTSRHERDYISLKLHSLLESHTQPTKPKEAKSPYRVKFKPPVPKFPRPQIPSHHTRSTPLPTSSQLSSSKLYQSVTTRIGPHLWETCPRRSPLKRQRSYSAPSSPARRLKTSNSENIRPASACFDCSLALSDLENTMDELVDTRPPFVVRHVDPRLMSRRDFCGCSKTKSAGSSGGESGLKHSDLRRDRGLGDLELNENSPAYFNTSLRTSNKKYAPTTCEVLQRSKSPVIMSRPRSVQFTTPPDTLTQPHLHCYHSDDRRELVTKYLGTQPGNVRRGVASPGKLIEERIEKLRKECCACEHRADSLGEDELSEDLERLRASLQAERDHHLSNTARFMPADNVTVKIGPRDYWSQRMSEFTGKNHRLLFDETLEKIYNKLYTDASQSV